MKKQAKKRAATADFFGERKIGKFMKKHKAGIDAKSHHLEFLETLARIRKENNITQKQLARITNIGQDELSRIEQGRKNITFSTFYRILNGLGYEAEIRYHKIHGAAHSGK